MLKIALIYVHLLSTCVAIGMIALTDLRLLGRVFGTRVVIPTPSRLETRAIMLALLVLYATGAGLVALGLAERADYLTNQKLQAKLVLVALLTANAFVLHQVIFPLLERRAPVAHWTVGERWQVAASVGLSNSLWLYCAFLGIARPWNYTMPLGQVLAIAPVLWLMVAASVRFALAVAARDEPQARGDWIDSVKSSLGGYRHDFEHSSVLGT